MKAERRDDFGGATNYGVVRVGSLDEIRRILFDFDNTFSPRLSTAVSLDELAQKFHKHAVVMAAQYGDMVGFTAFYSNDMTNRIAFISLTGVKVSVRNRGVGTALLKASMVFAKAHGMRKMRFEVYKQNADSIRFHEKHGFKITGEASAHTHFMTCDL